ncbi:unnamed protein product [Linum trigynum]|uniref:Uncharacterized protein n=1 Tax=Linum trigynum TaxID=586398 RepID=A0AAV2DE32_9ROSI
MVKKQRMNNESYKFIMKALSDHERLDEVLQLVDAMLDNEAINVNEELQEINKEEETGSAEGNDVNANEAAPAAAESAAGEEQLIEKAESVDAEDSRDEVRA